MADDAFARLIRSAGVTETNRGGNSDFIGSVNGRAPYPLETWAPEHCGQLDMAIDRDGRWFHEGSEIKRSELVSLFAGLLRKESDGAFYLVTPVEKVEVSVALHPLMVVDASQLHDSETGEGSLGLVLNTGGIFKLNAETGLHSEARAAGAAFVCLPYGLTALFTRAAWYRLVEMADDTGCIVSGGERYSLL